METPRDKSRYECRLGTQECVRHGRGRPAMKLVVYDPAWPLYLPLLRSALKTDWRIEAGAGDEAWLCRELAGADALLALKLPPHVRAAARGLKLLLFPGAGVMHSVPDELPDGCSLANVYEHEIPIAEYVMMAVLMHVTRALEHSAAFREGRWDGNGRIGGRTHEEAFGKTLAIVGYGHIGQTLGHRARAFGMRVEAVRQSGAGTVDPAPDFLGGSEDLDAMIARADVLVIACPLTEWTRGLIDARRLGLMKDGTLLVNVARGEIVDEDSLYEALAGGRIHAALDVWYQYPSREGEELHGSRLPFHRLPNVFVTPHLSAWSGALIERRMKRIAENLDRLARGEPLERVVLRGSWRS